MSLNWNFTDKARYDKLTDQEKAFNDAFVWGCLSIGMRTITEENAAEWHKRYSFAVALNGGYFLVNKKPYTPTLDEVKKRIGLTTNVSTMTRNQFVKKHVELFKI